jgi:hypothetical protein
MLEASLFPVPSPGNRSTGDWFGQPTEGGPLASQGPPGVADRVEKVVGYPPLSEASDLQRREFHEALLEAASFEDLPGKWQAAMLEAEQNRPKLRVVRGG